MRPCDRVAKAAANRFSIGQLGLLRHVSIENEIPPRDEPPLPAVANAPVHKECPLVFQARGQRPVFDSQVAGFIPTVPQLPLPAGEVSID